MKDIKNTAEELVEKGVLDKGLLELFEKIGLNFSELEETSESWKDKLTGRLNTLGLIWKRPEYEAFVKTLLMDEDAIFGFEDALKGNYPAIVITEEVNDAEAVDRIDGMRGVAILSTHLSEGQLSKLFKFPKKDTLFYVALGADAQKDAVKVAKKLY
ncbi:unnamed protein product, partial [marine sediment metagenome]